MFADTKYCLNILRFNKKYTSWYSHVTSEQKCEIKLATFKKGNNNSINMKIILKSSKICFNQFYTFTWTLR